jgi:hypothetical protein
VKDCVEAFRGKHFTQRGMVADVDLVQDYISRHGCGMARGKIVHDTNVMSSLQQLQTTHGTDETCSTGY